MTITIGIWSVFDDHKTPTRIKRLAGTSTQEPTLPEWYLQAVRTPDTLVFNPVDLNDLFGSSMGDGSHWGLSDWYDVQEGLLRLVLEHDISKWDTGWYSSKKEIASGRIKRLGNEIVVEASVSDDFDTPGHGTASIIAEGATIELIAEALYEAWEAAEGDQEDNRPYEGFSVGPADKDGTIMGWEYTLVLPRQPKYAMWSSCEIDTPPGDNYHHWGWEDVTPEPLDDEDEKWNAEALKDFSAEDRKVFEEWANAYIEGIEEKETAPVHNGMTIKPW